MTAPPVPEYAGHPDARTLPLVVRDAREHARYIEEVHICLGARDSLAGRARASIRPIRNWLTIVFRTGQLWETCQFWVSCTNTRSPASIMFPAVVFS